MATIHMQGADQVVRILAEAHQAATMAVVATVAVTMRALVDEMRGEPTAHMVPWRNRLAAKGFSTRTEMRRPLYRQP